MKYSIGFITGILIGLEKGILIGIYINTPAEKKAVAFEILLKTFANQLLLDGLVIIGGFIIILLNNKIKKQKKQYRLNKEIARIGRIYENS